LALDRENRKLLGVCAGLANYLDVEAWIVRLVFLGALIFGVWFLIPLYFVAWFLLDESSAKVREVVDSHMITHFKNVDYKKKLYRNTQDGKVFGVCAGIADYLEVRVFAVRMIFLLLVCFTGFLLLFYFGAALVLDKKPLATYSQATAYADARRKAGSSRGDEAADTQAEAEWEGEASMARARFSKRHEFQYCARKLATLQTRLTRIEAYVTSKRFRLNREFRAMP
jgi:phage shock protein C